MVPQKAIWIGSQNSIQRYCCHMKVLSYQNSGTTMCVYICMCV